jgi:hypothetical protein
MQATLQEIRDLRVHLNWCRVGEFFNIAAPEPNDLNNNRSIGLGKINCGFNILDPRTNERNG